MAQRARAADDQVADFVPEVETPGTPKRFEEWDGRSTRIVLARPLLRHHRLIGPGTKCLDCCYDDHGAGHEQKRHKTVRGRCTTCDVPDDQCAARSHHFHVQASQSRDGTRWLGPEADQIVAHIADGIVEGTQAKVDRDRRQAAVEVARNVHGELVTDPDGNVVMRPMPELAEQTLEDVQRTWAPALRGGPRERIRRERQEARRRDEGDDANAIRTLARAIRLANSDEALEDDTEPDWPGAQAAGTGPKGKETT